MQQITKTMKKFLFLILMMLPIMAMGADIFRIKNATIKYDKQETLQVKRAIGDLQADAERVTGCRPTLSTKNVRGPQIIVGTYGKSPLIQKLIKQGVIKEADLKGKWESYVLTVTNEKEPRLVIAGSDTRGTIYGIYDISERMGVSPWYWWADVPVCKNPDVAIQISGDYFASGEPAVKYRGIFINDEDWGLKPWASNHFEKELGDIGPRTYAKVCELLLRLRANMLAPAMHSCTGAFYSHPESKVVCDSFGIIITTSHCEPLLLNNAANEAAKYENIYTVAMRGVHDEGIRGNLPMSERVPLIEQVIRDQRELLEKHSVSRFARDIPQIFVPYKETMDIYENGLKVPDDITLVWVDDNYGYMKRVANPEEQKRSGRSGVYYHLSYLGAPHDYLWLNTTPPVLMYEELRKAYDNGADRYWLLNVGDIKPMELGMQTFFDMAWDINAFDFEKVYQHQAEFLARTFGHHTSQLSVLSSQLQIILDDYYRLAWSRKPEFMGWEYQWDDKAHTGLKPTEFSFEHYDEAQRRLADYQRISDEVERISSELRAESLEFATAFFELLQFPVQAACQMNRKFLMAQLNQLLAEKGRFSEANWAARQMEEAYDSINALNRRYNKQLNGKWDGMMALSTSFTNTCQFYQKPEVKRFEGAGEKAVLLTPLRGRSAIDCKVIDLQNCQHASEGTRIVHGLGYDGKVVQFGDPSKESEDGALEDIFYWFKSPNCDSVDIIVYTVPFWPLYKGKQNRVGVSVDDSPVQVFENKFKEYDRTWKDQVMRNGAVCRLRFAVNKNHPYHELRLAGDPGQMIQRVIIDWGGLRPSYIGPTI